MTPAAAIALSESIGAPGRLACDSGDVLAASDLSGPTRGLATFGGSDGAIGPVAPVLVSSGMTGIAGPWVATVAAVPASGATSRDVVSLGAVIVLVLCIRSGVASGTVTIGRSPRNDAPAPDAMAGMEAVVAVGGTARATAVRSAGLVTGKANGVAAVEAAVDGSGVAAQATAPVTLVVTANPVAVTAPIVTEGSTAGVALVAAAIVTPLVRAGPALVGMPVGVVDTAAGTGSAGAAVGLVRISGPVPAMIAEGPSRMSATGEASGPDTPASEPGSVESDRLVGVAGRGTSQRSAAPGDTPEPAGAVLPSL